MKWVKFDEKMVCEGVKYSKKKTDFFRVFGAPSPFKLSCYANVWPSWGRQGTPKEQLAPHPMATLGGEQTTNWLNTVI